MTPVLPVLLFAACPVVDLDRTPVEAARELAGRTVWASFVVAAPTYTLKGRTVVGAAEQPDQVARGAVLKGNRLDVEAGKRVTVRGIAHPPGFVGRVFVPGWAEVRVEE